MKPDAADIFFLAGLALVAIGIYLRLPFVLPYYLMLVGAVFIFLGLKNVVKKGG